MFPLNQFNGMNVFPQNHHVFNTNIHDINPVSLGIGKCFCFNRLQLCFWFASLLLLFKPSKYEGPRVSAFCLSFLNKLVFMCNPLCMLNSPETKEWLIKNKERSGVWCM